jgi:hypothetical protein
MGKILLFICLFGVSNIHSQNIVASVTDNQFGSLGDPDEPSVLNTPVVIIKPTPVVLVRKHKRKYHTKIKHYKK